MESETTTNASTISSSDEEIIAKGNGRAMGPMAENTDSSSTTRPARPDESTDTGTPPEMNCEEGEECEMPEPPEGFDGEMPTDMEGGFPGRQFESQTSVASDSILHPVAYLAIGGVSVILGILVSYTCFSTFFKKRPGETFKTLPRFIWFIIVSVLIAAGLITLGYFIPIWTR